MSKTDAGVVDIDAYIPDQPFELAIVKPGTNVPTGWVITLASPDHPKALAYQTATSKARLQKQARIEAQQANGRKVKPEERGVDEQREDNVAWVVSRILDWTPFKSALFENEVLSFSDENAHRVFLHPKMGWAFAQVVDHLTEEANFTRTSARP